MNGPINYGFVAGLTMVTLASMALMAMASAAPTRRRSVIQEKKEIGFSAHGLGCSVVPARMVRVLMEGVHAPRQNTSFVNRFEILELGEGVRLV